jgi:hypothetical protein
MISNEIKSYWDCLDDKLNELMSNGYCYLPSIDGLIDTKSISDNILNDISDKVYTSELNSHTNFCKDFGITNILAPRLHELARKHHNFKGLVSDQYNIARKVSPGLSSEAYRGHFDSHCFTLVVPITIPKKEHNSSMGELIFFPNLRKFPSNEMLNFFGKLYYKRYASKKGFEDLSRKKANFVANFQDNRPLIFIGNTTLHGNLPVDQIAESYRLTLLTHFFDPSPSWGIGNVLRKIRNR